MPVAEGTGADEITLEKIDQVRRRLGVSYRRAYEALERSGGDVVQAIIALESSCGPRSIPGRLQAGGEEVAERIRELIHEGNATRIVVKHGDRTVVEVPATVGALGAIFLPTLTVAGLAAALATRSSIVVERRRGGSGDGSGL
jgi:molybdenum-dependent DNA-binding transcriptional regulator ModE